MSLKSKVLIGIGVFLLAIFLYSYIKTRIEENSLTRSSQEIQQLRSLNQTLTTKNEELSREYSRVMDSYNAKDQEIASLNSILINNSSQLSKINTKIGQISSQTKENLASVEKPIDNKQRCLRICSDLRNLGYECVDNNYCSRY